MRTDKKFSSATFTKRVDHDKGQHKTPRSPSEPALCEVCGAVYSERRWTSAGQPRKTGKHKHWRAPKITVCPACKTEREGVPGGFVYLEGAYLALHRDEVDRLLDNEAGRASSDNPLGRIMSRDSDKEGRLVVATTTPHLAARLGQALDKAFGGDVRYDFSHENQLARVYWRRDE
jgi:hypothetical protein